VEIPRERLVVVTGLSGSGKSSLAFDTIYAEGQRRYIESLSAYARQFLGMMEKPDVDAMEGLSPAISIEQKSVSRNPRSTVGTVTEIYDYLRLLYARAGTPYCPRCDLPIRRQPATRIVSRLLEMEEGTRIQVLAPLHAVNPLRRIIADTYQSVSGAGGRAMEELAEQTAAQARGETPAVDPDVFPHVIASNLIPSIDSPRDDGYSKEEWKVWAESRKIMHIPDLAVSATCVRVPVFRAHSAAVHAEFSEPFDADEARAMLEDVPGVQVVDDLASEQYPMPSDASGNDTTWVGRIRQDMSHPNGLVFWVVSDNLRKGAATNSIQIAEAAIANHWLKQAQPA